MQAKEKLTIRHLTHGNIKLCKVLHSRPRMTLDLFLGSA